MKQILLISTIVFSTIANADNLKLSNETKYNLSFSTNGVCSQTLGDLKKYTVKIINQTSFEDTCQYNPKQCVIEVYNKLDCAGKTVANMVFDETNIISVATSGDIMIRGNGSNIFFTSK